MTKLINPDFKGLNRMAHNENPLSLELRLPSPPRGRGAGGEGDRQPVVTCLPFSIQSASPVFVAKSRLHATPDHPQPLSPSRGARGAKFSMPLRLQGGQRSLSARSQRLGQRILVASLGMLVFAATPGLLAQVKKVDKPTEQPASTKPQATAERQQHVQKVFAIKHADVEAIARTLRIFPVPVDANRELRVIGVSAPPALLPTIEEIIRRLDVPPPTPQNVELTVYLLLASDQEAGSVAPELEAVVKQLKTTFAFKGFRTIDTLVVRSRDKQAADVKGLAKVQEDNPRVSTYSLAYRAASILPDEKGRSIRLDGLRFNARIVVKTQWEGPRLPTAQDAPAATAQGFAFDSHDAGFGTDVDIREGQKVVVGKAAVGGTNTALILVITAKVLE